MAGILDLFNVSKPPPSKPKTVFEADMCTVTLPDEVSEDLSTIVQSAFQEARAVGIKMVVFDMVQRGGEVDHMDCVLSEFEAWQQIPGNIVGVVCRGMCASAGIFMVGMATPGYRFAVPHTKFLIHSAYTNQTIGLVNAQAQNEQKWHQYTTRETFARLEKRIGRRMGFLQDVLHESAQGQDLNIDCTRALQLGIIDHVGYPRFESEVRTNVFTKVYLGTSRYKKPIVTPHKIEDDDECAALVADFVKEDIDDEFRPEKSRRRKKHTQHRGKSKKLKKKQAATGASSSSSLSSSSSSSASHEAAATPSSSTKKAKALGVSASESGEQDAAQAEAGAASSTKRGNKRRRTETPETAGDDTSDDSEDDDDIESDIGLDTNDDEDDEGDSDDEDELGDLDSDTSDDDEDDSPILPGKVEDTIGKVDGSKDARVIGKKRKRF